MRAKAFCVCAKSFCYLETIDCEDEVCGDCLLRICATAPFTQARTSQTSIQQYAKLQRSTPQAILCALENDLRSKLRPKRVGDGGEDSLAVAQAA